MKQHSHMDHHQMMVEDFRKRFFVVLVLTIPILLLSPTVAGWIGYELPDILWLKFVLFLLATAVATWGAKPFYTHALIELKRKQLGMMVLVSLAVGSGYIYSVATTFFIDAPGFYWEISTLTLFLLFGHWMEMRSVVGASGALKELAKLIPPKANLVGSDGEIREVNTEKLKKDDMVLVRPGEKVPIDGIVIEGESNVNEALITGESKPVKKGPDSEVIGGTLNQDGSLKIQVTKVGKETAVSQIMHLVEEAQGSKPRTQKLADRAAHYLTITAIAVGLITLLTWNFFLGASFVFALTLTISVIVITCPHALGLAIPMVTTVTTSLAAKNGILIKDMNGLERARKVTTVLFDKTGTLTKGEFGVSKVKSLSGDQNELLRVAASVEQHSEHVIAKSIVKAAREKSLNIVEPKDFSYTSGKGVIGKIEGRGYVVGNKGFMSEHDIELREVEQDAKALSSEGKTVIYIASEGQIKGLIALSDIIKDESREAVKKLQSRGLKVAMLTGDNRAVAKHVAKELGLDTFFAEVLPEEKIKKVKELQSKDEIVMMVGDGVNDAPALTQADIGVAVGAGTDVAVASSEVVLVKNNPMDIVKLLELSQKTREKMVQNLAWATGYNIIAIPLAAGVLYPYGIFLRPEWGALIMSASSVIVVANALTLRKVEL